MAPLTSSQRSLVAQFIQATGTNEKVAQRFLKNAGYKLDVAADAYFNNNPSLASASSGNDSKLDKLFSELRNPEEDGQDELGAESVMNYATSLSVNPLDAGVFVLMELVKAPSLGVVTRQGFIDGWKATDAAPTKAGQKDYIQRAIRGLATNPDLFKRVYQYAFVIGKRTPESREIPLENAIPYWKCLFSPPGRPWVSPSTGTKWLTRWTDYMEEKWTHTVTRDMWNQLHNFAIKSTDDPGLGFWNPEGAWPSVIDSFVEWVRANPDRGGSQGAAAQSSMEVDEA